MTGPGPGKGDSRAGSFTPGGFVRRQPVGVPGRRRTLSWGSCPHAGLGLVVLGVAPLVQGEGVSSTDNKMHNSTFIAYVFLHTCVILTLKEV